MRLAGWLSDKIHVIFKILKFIIDRNNRLLALFNKIGILQLDIWESILLLHCHRMSIVLKLLLKLPEFSIFFSVPCSYSCSRNSKYKSFHAFVLPILEYACQAWNPHTQKCIKQLESIQCHSARWVCGARYNPSNFT